MPKSESESIRYRLVKGQPDLGSLEATIRKAIEYLQGPVYVIDTFDPRLGLRYSPKLQTGATGVLHEDEAKSGKLFTLSARASGVSSLSSVDHFSDRANHSHAEAAHQYRGQGLVVLVQYFEPASRSQPFVEEWECLIWIPLLTITPTVTFPDFKLQSAEAEPAIA